MQLVTLALYAMMQRVLRDLDSTKFSIIRATAFANEVWCQVNRLNVGNRSGILYKWSIYCLHCLPLEYITINFLLWEIFSSLWRRVATQTFCWYDNITFNLFQFRSHSQYCIIAWGRACKTSIQPVPVLKNRLWKYMTFTDKVQTTFLNYLKCSVSDLYQVNFEKFMCKYNANICPRLLITFFKTVLHTWSRHKYQKIFIINV